MPHGSSGWRMHQDPMRASKRTLFRTRAAALSSGASLLRASAATPARLYVTGRMMRFSTPVSTCVRQEAGCRDVLTPRVDLSWGICARLLPGRIAPKTRAQLWNPGRHQKDAMFCRDMRAPTNIFQHRTHLLAPVVDSLPLDFVGLAALVDLILKDEVMYTGLVRFLGAFHATLRENQACWLSASSVPSSR